MTNEERVLDYIKNREQSALHFNKEIPNAEEMDIYTLVNTVLEVSRNWESYTEDGNYQCDDGRFRSSLDIWRHVIYFQPQISIFDVMRALYENRENLYGQYCWDVHRRVFKYGRKAGLALLDSDETDEYGLDFYDWEIIGI